MATLAILDKQAAPRGPGVCRYITWSILNLFVIKKERPHLADSGVGRTSGDMQTTRFADTWGLPWRPKLPTISDFTQAPSTG
jgi:hypothetical protein